jgi:hypothetical protein
MHHDNCSVEQAMERMAEMHQQYSRRFLQLRNDLPSWGPAIDPIAGEYVQAFADWATGNYYWQFENGRYFGSKGKEVYQTRMVAWLPKYNN